MTGVDNSEFEAARARMVELLIEQDRVTDPAVIDALQTVPRHKFVPEQHRASAYTDRPLPIGDEQTISAPHMVAIMTELLDLSPGQTVLEIGTGRGYHAAVVAELVGGENVYTVEYSAELASRARERFSELEYDISVRIGDGRDGWPEQAPFQASYLTCAPASLPEAIPEQVVSGGRIVAPIGRGSQTLYRYIKQDDGSLKRDSHGSVRFVPLR